MTAARTLHVRRWARAFTLVEVMIVVCVVAICSALAVPLLKDTDTSKLRAAAGVVVADLEYAQVESITHPDALRVMVFDSSTATYRIATAATPATPITNPVGKLPYTTTFGSGRAQTLSGVTIVSYSLGGDAQLGFGAYGQLDQSAAATVTLGSGARRVTITLDASTGEASVGAIQ